VTTEVDVRLSSDEAVYEVSAVRAAELVEALAGTDVAPGTIVQIGDDVVFSAPRSARRETGSALDGLGATWSERGRLAKLTVAGVSNPPLRVLALLDAAGVEPQFVSASPAAATVFVAQSDADRAAKALANAPEPAGA
jgi:hypothetical protein